MRPLMLFVLVETVALALLAARWFGSEAAGEPVLVPAAPTTAPKAPSPASGSSADAPSPQPAPAPAATPRIAAAHEGANVVAGDPVGVLLQGTVRSAVDGSLLDGVNVTLHRDKEYRIGTSAGGDYAIAGLAAGEWIVRSRAEGFAPHEATVVLDERAFQRLELELAPSYVVQVKILDSAGKPLERGTSSMVAVATEEPLAGDLPPTFQSALRSFGIGEWSSYDGFGGRAQPKKLEAGFAGELLLRRAPPAFASLLLRSTLLQSQRIEPDQREVVFTLDAADLATKFGTVRLRLLDDTGQPIAGVRVGIGTAQGGGGGVVTGDDGVATTTRALPGIGQLTLHGGKDREGLNRFVRVPAGGTLDLGDVVLGAAEKLTGVVLGPDGKPANGARVQWTELDGRTFPGPLVDNHSTQADAEGRFEIWHCGRRRYVVNARSSSGAFGFATVDARNGAPTQLSIHLSTPTTVSLRCTAPATAGYVVTALAPDRSPAAVAVLGTEYRPPSMELPPGSYTIEIHDMLTDALKRSFPLEVGAQPLTIEVP
jgi:hypothetical protein